MGTGMNIAVDELARSLFAEQLLVAASAAGPESVLLLEQSTLRNDQEAALKSVLSLVGLNRGPAPVLPSLGSFEKLWGTQAREFLANETAGGHSGSDTEHIVTKAFAKFHNNGWAAKGDYPPLAVGLESKLRRFFAPFNRGLDSLASVLRA